MMNKRNFMKTGIKAVAALLGLHFIHNRVKGKDAEETDMVKMLTKDGKLVWVDKSVMEDNPLTPPISNKSLHSWINLKKV